MTYPSTEDQPDTRSPITPIDIINVCDALAREDMHYVEPVTIDQFVWQAWREGLIP